VPNLLLVTGAIYAFSRFLGTERVRYLYLAALSLGLAFYCKESTALLMPVFGLTLLISRHRRWLLRPHVYLACIVYLLVLGPDIAWNLRTDPETATVTYNNQTVGQATYAAHFRRFGGVGFSPYPSMFYLRSAVLPLYPRITGTPLRDETEEYWSVNAGLGVLLLAAVLAATVRPRRRDPLWIFLLVMFWGIFVFFTLIKRGDPPFRLDPVSWIWVEITILPAIVLTGARLADLRGRWRAVAWALAGLVLATAGAQLVSIEYAEDAIVHAPHHLVPPPS
jgi:4-amino-4-deoxy-L-arabinose transferase-like glycosyltransferase